MNYTITPYKEKYLNELKLLADKNKDVLKPNTKMLYFVVARLFSKVSYVAILNNNVIGFIISFKNGNHIWLHQLAVDKNHRGKGIAKTLLRELETAAAQCTIEFSVKKDNYTAIALYEKLGYEKSSFHSEIEQIIYHKVIGMP